jgi:hypothetical protein
LSQRGENGGFVEPPVWPARLGNQPLPLLSERHRCVGRDVALAGPVEIAQQANSGERWVMRARRRELKGVEEVGSEFAQRPVAVSGTLQRVFAGEIGEFSDFALSSQQPRPANGFVDDREGVALAALGCGKGFDRVMEQPHQAADIPCSGDIAALARLAGARE